MKNVIHDLYDSASYELQGIRSKISSTNQRIRQNLDRIVKSQANQKKLSDAIITVRNDRNVIPVKAEYRQDFKGLFTINLPLDKRFISNHHQL